MNLLLLDQFSEMGGAQRCLLDLIPAFRERGWRISAAMPGGGPMFERMASMDVSVTRLPCRPYSSGSKTLGDFWRFASDMQDATRIVRQLVQERAIDLIYVNGPRMLPAARLSGVPFCFHAHNKLTKWHDLLVVRWALRQATVIACSEFVAGPLRPFCRPVIVPNACEDLGFRRLASGRPVRIGVVGRIAPEKGQLEFVDAVRLLGGKIPECRFVICGDDVLSRPGYKDLVLRKAAGTPISFAGWMNEPAEALRQVDVLVVPSTGADATPRVILEAFSAGVPVVAFAAGGIPELVEDGETGFLVHPRTAEALAARLAGLLHNTGELTRVAANARRKWAAGYTLERYRNQVAGLLETCVPRSRIQKSMAATAPTTPAPPRVAE
ncbi:glycosyltransferase family 4 protein [Paludibaculum fermentans]|uniref:Glycosyltransferase family 4 protein n=1 Tax=Paludibaculum fermentans TaxID=1473598 RepID=A0A7S7NRG7_PALFE|nr:glycosyltransferase family 4 protein [Paludibaculum fermentans]QOY88457.1 glycosyltransferase family 4 protein [Paludibaculum fermentans]